MTCNVSETNGDNIRPSCVGLCGIRLTGPLFLNARLTKGVDDYHPLKVFSFNSKTLYTKRFLIAVGASFAVILMQKRDL